ncbi:hypothetical protein D3C71_1762440 [compost metagenome]
MMSGSPTGTDCKPYPAASNKPGITATKSPVCTRPIIVANWSTSIFQGKAMPLACNTLSICNRVELKGCRPTTGSIDTCVHVSLRCRGRKGESFVNTRL